MIPRLYILFNLTKEDLINADTIGLYKDTILAIDICTEIIREIFLYALT